MRRPKFWFRNEKEVMRRFGFEPVKGSGSGEVDKEDGENEFAIAQLKSTEADSFRVRLLDLQKLEHHARMSRKLPVFFIQFLGRETYMLVNVNDFSDLRDVSFGKKTLERVNNLPDSEAIIKRDKVVTGNREREKFLAERERGWNDRRKR